MVKVQILDFLDNNVLFNSKNEIFSDLYYTDKNAHDYLLYESAH